MTPDLIPREIFLWYAQTFVSPSGRAEKLVRTAVYITYN